MKLLFIYIIIIRFTTYLKTTDDIHYLYQVHQKTTVLCMTNVICVASDFAFFYFVNKSLPIVFHYSNHQLNCTQNMTVIQMLPIHLLRFRSPLRQSTSNNKSLTVPHYLNINYHPDLTHHRHQLIRIMYPYQVSYGVWHVYPWIDNSNRTQLT